MAAVLGIRIANEVVKRPSNVILFEDNDAAQSALLRGYTRDEIGTRAIAEFWLAQASGHSHIWVERIDSAANKADGPSRLSVPNMKRDFPFSKAWPTPNPRL